MKGTNDPSEKQKNPQGLALGNSNGHPQKGKEEENSGDREKNG